MRRLVMVVLVLVMVQWVQCLLDAQVPQPFPRPPAQGRPAPAAPPPSGPPPATTPPPPAAATVEAARPAPAADAAPTEASLGFALYPNSRFIKSYDAGRGQRYYLFGSAASFPELVKYYQSLLKTKGTLVFEAPATHIFEMGRFDEKTMAFPAGVTIKDYTWGGSAGYLSPQRDGTAERFPSIIQIVPALQAPPR